jgi:tRNA(Ile)-lysidine synthase
VSKALGATVARALEDAGVRRGDGVVVAVSGGVDSMVLLDVLVRLAPRLDLRLHVAHIHHGRRGQSADRDAAFVSAEAVRSGLRVSVERLIAETRPRGASVEMWAREARYACLEAIRKRVRAGWILTAHTQNDQAETVLLNLLRGTGPRGLAGIPRVRQRILRPLLTVSRAAIQGYSAAAGVAFREDPSNQSTAYRRNRVRQHLLPLLAREYNPRIVEALAALAAQAREDEEAFASQTTLLGAAAIRQRVQAVGVKLSLLRAAPPAVTRRLFQEAFRRAAARRDGLTRRHLLALTQLATRGGRALLPGGLRAWVSPQYVWLGPAAPARSPRRAFAANSPMLPLRPGRWVPWEPGRCAVRVHRVARDGIRLTAGDRQREILSPTALAWPLSLRGWRRGDRFQPLGLSGTKKLQDFFVDAKIPRAERGRVPLLLAGDRIAWVVGHRISDAFRWKGEPMACVAEVRFLEEQHGVPPRQTTAFGR